LLSASPPGVGTGARLTAFAAALVVAWLGASPPATADPAASSRPLQLKLAFSADDDAERDQMLGALRRFSEAHPHLRVHPIPRLWRAHSTHDSYLRFLALEDPSVDVYLADLPWIPEFADPGWLHPLDEDLLGDLPEVLVGPALAGGTYRGRIYGLPLSLKGNLLFYRRDLLEQHGLGPPTSLAELDRQARLLRRVDAVEVGIALHPLYFYNDAFPFMWASGGEVVGADGRVHLDAPLNVRVLEGLVGLMGGPAPPALDRSLFYGPWARDYRAPLHPFAEGRAAFLIDWSPRVRVFDRAGSPVAGRVGVAAIPGLQAGRGGSSSLGSWYLVVSAFSAHKHEAQLLAQFLCSPAEQRDRLERLGEVPARTDLLEDPDLARSHPRMAELGSILARSRPRPRVPNEHEVDGLIEAALHRALRAEQSPAEALAQAARQVRAVRLPPLPESSAPPLADVVAASGPTWGYPLLASGGSIAVVLALLALLLRRHRRRGLVVLGTIAAKLAVLGTTTILVLMLLAAGLSASHAVAEQQTELRQSLAFHAASLHDTARTLGRHLSLSLSLLADHSQADDLAAADAPLAPLMLASHFSEDLLFMELLGRDGELLRSDSDQLFVTLEQRPRRAPPSADLLPRILRRSLHVARRSDGDRSPYLEVLAPVFRQGVHVGAVRLGISEARHRAHIASIRARHGAALRRILALSAGVTALLIALGVALIVLLARSMARPIVALTRQARRIQGGDLDVRFDPGPQDEIGTLAATMEEMVAGLRDRDFIRETFGRYVTPELAEQLIDDRDSLRLGGSVCEVSLLMSDLRGFTGLSATLGPERMVELLNRYLSCMTEVIVATGGTINEFIGDAILVLFGAPVPCADHALRAARCAAAMQQAMVTFNEESGALGLPALEMGIAVNSGPVVAGNIGGRQRVKYGVVGDTVNMTGRLESLTLGGEVLLSGSTWSPVAHEVRAEGPRAVRVKGRAEPLDVYQLQAVRAGTDWRPLPGQAPGEDVACDLSVRWLLLEGKTVGDHAMQGRLRRLWATGAILETEAPPSPLQNLEVHVRFGPDPEPARVYAKVVRAVPVGSEDAAEGASEPPASDATAGSVELRFTSLDPQDRAALQTLLRAQAPRPQAQA